MESEVSERNFLSFPGFEHRKDFPALSGQIGKKSGKSFRGKTFRNTLLIAYFSEELWDTPWRHLELHLCSDVIVTQLSESLCFWLFGKLSQQRFSLSHLLHPILFNFYFGYVVNACSCSCFVCNLRTFRYFCTISDVAVLILLTTVLWSTFMAQKNRDLFPNLSMPILDLEH